MSGLTRQQRTALMYEQQASRQLLAHGVTLVTTAPNYAPILDPLFTCWSIGLEKLLKIARGLLDIEAGNSWELRKTHDLPSLAQPLLEHLDSRAEPRTPYLRGLVAQVVEDPGWEPLLAALSEYGRMGRFRHLDDIGGHPNDMTAVEDSWSHLEAVANNDPEVAALWATFDASEEASDRLHAVQGRVIARPLVNVWLLITQAARHGAFGELGVAFGADSEPQNALPRIDPAAFVAAPSGRLTRDQTPRR